MHPMSASEAILSREPSEIRTLPSNVEAEAAFLGAVLIDNRILEELQTPLKPDHFFAAVHGLQRRALAEHSEPQRLREVFLAM